MAVIVRCVRTTSSALGCCSTHMMLADRVNRCRAYKECKKSWVCSIDESWAVRLTTDSLEQMEEMKEQKQKRKQESKGWFG